MSIEKMPRNPRRVNRADRPNPRQSVFLSVFRRGATCDGPAPCGRRVKRCLAYLKATWIEAIDGSDWYRVPLGERTVPRIEFIMRAAGMGRGCGPFWGMGREMAASGSGPGVNVTKRNVAIVREKHRAIQKAGYPGELLVALFGDSNATERLENATAAENAADSLPTDWEFEPALWFKLLGRWSGWERCFNAVMAAWEESQQQAMESHSAHVHDYWCDQVRVMNRWIRAQSEPTPTFAGVRKKPRYYGPLASERNTPRADFEVMQIPRKRGDES